MDYSYLSERIDGFIALIDLINSYKHVISSEEVKNSILRVALIVCSIDGEIHEKEKDLLNILFNEDCSVEEYEKRTPGKLEIEEFWNLTPSLMLKFTSEFDIVLKKIADTEESVAVMYNDLIVEVMKQCMLADERIDIRETNFIEAYDSHMKKYIKGM